MISDLARDDFEDLKAEGLNPTLDDFDRLNMLALRLEDGPETTPACHPRIGWAGDIPFHEPTVCAIMWLQDYASHASADEETQQAFFFFACAHATDPSAFVGLESPREIEKAVRDWLRSTPCTVREMARACRYAAWGYDDAVAAETQMAETVRRRADRDKAAENVERLERLLSSAAALSGLSFLDFMAQTPSRLNAMVLAAQVEAGACLKRNVSLHQVRYLATLKEIRERLRSECGLAGQSE